MLRVRGGRPAPPSRMELEGRRCDPARRCCRRARLGRPCPHCAQQFVSLTGAWVGWDGHAMRSMCAPPLRFGERTQAKRELGGSHRFDLVGVQQAGYNRRNHVLRLYGRRHGGTLRARGERPGRLRGSASLHVPIERTTAHRPRPRGAAKARRSRATAVAIYCIWATYYYPSTVSGLRVRLR